MDSLQAKRANAISFQVRLRDKTQPVIKRQTRQLPVGFVGLSGFEPNHTSDQGPESCHFVTSNFRSVLAVDKSCTAVLLEV